MIIGISGKINSGKDEVGKIIEYLTRDVKFSSYSYEEYYQVVSELMHRWKIKKFADKLKDMVCLLLSCTRRELEDRKFKETELGEQWWFYTRIDDPSYKLYTLKEYEGLLTNQKDWLELNKLTPRKLLQLLGTDCGRHLIHPDIWCNALMEGYKNKYEFYRGQNHMLILQGVMTEEQCMPDWVITDVRFPNEVDAVEAKKGLMIRVTRPKPRVRLKNPITEAIINNTVNFGVIEHESETALDDHKFKYVINNTGTIDDLIVKVEAVLKAEGIL